MVPDQDSRAIAAFREPKVECVNDVGPAEAGAHEQMKGERRPLGQLPCGVPTYEVPCEKCESEKEECAAEPSEAALNKEACGTECAAVEEKPCDGQPRQGRPCGVRVDDEGRSKSHTRNKRRHKRDGDPASGRGPKGLVDGDGLSAC